MFSNYLRLLYFLLRRFVTYDRFSILPDIVILEEKCNTSLISTWRI
jgi:hypothetical protein